MVRCFLPGKAKLVARRPGVSVQRGSDASNRIVAAAIKSAGAPASAASESVIIRLSEVPPLA